jgi:hypothetical protein
MPSTGSKVFLKTDSQKMVYKFIVDKYNLVPEDKKADFERIVDSSLRLLMFQPKIRSGLTACFAFLSCK